MDGERETVKGRGEQYQMNGKVDWDALLKLTLILSVWGIICGLFIPYPYGLIIAPLGGLIIGFGLARAGLLWWKPE